MIHIVKQGETINSIAAEYNVSPQRLMFDNQIVYGSILAVGQALLVLIPSLVHYVKEGETLSSIARQYGISLRQLLRNNPFLSDSYIYPGEYLVIDYDNRDNKEITTGGYAYPFINQDLLQEILPYLSEISVFSYGFLENGTLLAPKNADAILNLAKDFYTDPILVLTPHSTSEVFDNRLINNLIDDNVAQDRLITQLVNEMLTKGYKGINLDFEYIFPDNRSDYISFVQKMALELHNLGFTVSVALAPKTSPDQPGLLYEGIDYAGIGLYADTIFLMTYEWGYKYGPPMAIAPLPNVRKVVEYALTKISPNKIILGIPNYAYDWPLPFVKGVTGAETIGYIQAIDTAVRNNAEIQFDELAQSPFFEYSIDGNNHIVWFEDVRSIQAKFDLVKQFNLRGCGYWNLMRPFRSNYLLLNTNFNLY